MLRWSFAAIWNHLNIDSEVLDHQMSKHFPDQSGFFWKMRFSDRYASRIMPITPSVIWDNSRSYYYECLLITKPLTVQAHGFSPNVRELFLKVLDHQMSKIFPTGRENFWKITFSDRYASVTKSITPTVIWDDSISCFSSLFTPDPL